MDVILSKVRLPFSLVYFDDFVIFSRTSEEHIMHTSTVLVLLKDAGVICKLRKCSFFITRFDYIDDIIRIDQLGVTIRTKKATGELKNDIV